MKSLFRALWKDVSVGKNVTIWFTILAAVVIFVARLCGWVDEKWIAPFVVAAVALCLYEFLRLRATTEDLRVSSDSLTAELARTRQLLAITERANVVPGYPNLHDLYASAKSVCVLSVTCQQVFHEYKEVLTAHLTAGHTLRLLTVEPSQSVFDNVVYYGEKGNDAQRMCDGLRDKLGVFTSEWSSHIIANRCTIRALRHVPPYRVILVTDKMGVRSAVFLPRPLQVTGKKFLALEFKDPEHAEWINYLQAQFDALWSKSVLYQA